MFIQIGTQAFDPDKITHVGFSKLRASIFFIDGETMSFFFRDRTTFLHWWKHKATVTVL